MTDCDHNITGRTMYDGKTWGCRSCGETIKCVVTPTEIQYNVVE